MNANTIEIPIQLLYLFVASAFALQGWILKEIVSMKTDIAKIKGSVNTKRGNRLVLAIFLLLAPAFFMGCATTEQGKLKWVPPSDWIKDGKVNEDLKKSLDTIKQTSSILPSPIGEGLAFGSSALAGILALIARKKARQAAEADQTLDTVILGVEDQNLPCVKQKIRSLAIENGVEKNLRKRVKRLT